MKASALPPYDLGDSLSLCYTLRMIEITPTLKIDESKIQLDFIRASGPGGQNVTQLCTPYRRCPNRSAGSGRPAMSYNY